jgi:hypothetical protein
MEHNPRKLVRRTQVTLVERLKSLDSGMLRRGDRYGLTGMEEEKLLHHELTRHR